MFFIFKFFCFAGSVRQESRSGEMRFDLEKATHSQA
jgi:hypothetical protein